MTTAYVESSAPARSRIVVTLSLLLLFFVGRTVWNSLRKGSPLDQAAGGLFEPTHGERIGIIADRDEDPVSPELALIDPALRAHHEPVVRETIEPPLAAARAEAAPKPPRRTISRRSLLVASVTAGTLAAVATSAIYAERLTSGHRNAQIGNAASRAVTQHATANAVTASGRLFGWPPVADASAYTVEIIRSGELIYSHTTRAPNVRVPDRWQRNGRSMTLSPGTYRWYVWPVFGSGAGSHRGRGAVVAATLKIAP